MTRLQHLAKLVMTQGALGERPFVALENVETGTGRLLVNGALPMRSESDIGCAAIEPGDVLFGKLRPYLAKSWLCDQPAYASTELLALRPTDIADSRWLGYLMSSRPLIEWSVATSEGSKMPRTSWEKLRLFSLSSVPSVADQRLIADYLDRETVRIDALILNKVGFQSLLDEKIGSLIQERVGDIPTRRRLRHLAILGTGHTPDRRNSEYWENCVVPWVTAEDLSSRGNPFEMLMNTRQKISELGVANSSAVVHPRGTVMLCRTASIGLICQIGIPMATTQAFVTWSPGPELDSAFLMYALHSMRQEWMRLAFGSTHDTIYMPDLESVTIPYVPLAEQIAISREIDTSTSQILKAKELLNRQCETLKERRQALITAAVTGELNVPEVAA